MFVVTVTSMAVKYVARFDQWKLSWPDSLGGRINSLFCVFEG